MASSISMVLELLEMERDMACFPLMLQPVLVWVFNFFF